jgi:hypothetical protein
MNAHRDSGHSPAAVRCVDVQDTSIRIGCGMRDEPKTRAVVQAWRALMLLRRIGPDEYLVSRRNQRGIDSVLSRHESRFGNMIADGASAWVPAWTGLVNPRRARSDDMLVGWPDHANTTIEGSLSLPTKHVSCSSRTTGARRELLEHGVQRAKS